MRSIREKLKEDIEQFRKNLLAKTHMEREGKRRKKGSKQKDVDCKFCRQIKEKNGILFESEHLVVVFGRPHHKGHLVVMPRHHEENLLRLHEKTLDSFFNDTILVMKALEKAIKPDLFNLEYLDNWDSHVHWNLYPRFKSDPDYGNPPVIPNKGEPFKQKTLSSREINIFMHELAKIRSRLE
ncbi:HIT family protein [Candidatus Woesearchaeota archaeon]|nr:HIT family protein [Candidatus Woesearchaeota archaeon]